MLCLLNLLFLKAKFTCHHPSEDVMGFQNESARNNASWLSFNIEPHGPICYQNNMLGFKNDPVKILNFKVM